MTFVWSTFTGDIIEDIYPDMQCDDVIVCQHPTTIYKIKVMRLENKILPWKQRRGLELSRYEIESQNRVRQNDVTLLVTWKCL